VSRRFLEHVLLFSMLGFLSALVLQTAVRTWMIGASDMFTDFDAFYVAGGFFLEGRLADAYDVAIMTARQSEIAGESIFMPWTYPPQFNFVTGLLALGERGLSYAVFTFTTGLFFLLVLYRLAHRDTVVVLLTVFPGLAMTAVCGQNGFFTAGLIGAFCLLSLRGRPSAGLPLGLMVIKPHLAVGLGCLVLFARQWRVLAIALAVVAATSVASGVILGMEVWTAFLEATRTAGDNMEAGLYQMFRMTSVYAALHTMGASAEVALAIHAGVALLAVASIAWALRLGWSGARLLGVSVLASLAISPYNYDYDMPALAIAIALLAPCLMRHASRSERIMLLFSGWLCTGWGWATYIFFHDDTAFDAREWLSLGGVGFCLLWITTWRVLMRAHAAETGPVGRVSHVTVRSAGTT
jgi:hypothetical protein